MTTGRGEGSQGGLASIFDKNVIRNSHRKGRRLTGRCGFNS
jgi:hypothetical protein